MLALSAVMAGTGLLAVASHAFHTDGSASTMLLLVGLAVGVDYSLFYLRRTREERAAGRSTRDAIDAAAATSGRSVLVSGLTVIVAMAAMFLTGQGTFIGMAEATILVVAVAVLGSLTVLPATLSLLGDHVERGRIPWLGKRLQRRRDRGPSRLWDVTARARAGASPGDDDALRRVAARHRDPGRCACTPPTSAASQDLPEGPADHADLPASPAAPSPAAPRRRRSCSPHATSTLRR